jgi:hypothetical protein
MILIAGIASTTIALKAEQRARRVAEYRQRHSRLDAKTALDYIDNLRPYERAFNELATQRPEVITAQYVPAICCSTDELLAMVGLNSDDLMTLPELSLEQHHVINDEMREWAKSHEDSISKMIDVVLTKRIVFPADVNPPDVPLTMELRFSEVNTFIAILRGYAIVCVETGDFERAARCINALFRIGRYFNWSTSSHVNQGIEAIVQMATYQTLRELLVASNEQAMHLQSIRKCVDDAPPMPTLSFNDTAIYLRQMLLEGLVDVDDTGNPIIDNYHLGNAVADTDYERRVPHVRSNRVYREFLELCEFLPQYEKRATDLSMAEIDALRDRLNGQFSVLCSKRGFDVGPVIVWAFNLWHELVMERDATCVTLALIEARTSTGEWPSDLATAVEACAIKPNRIKYYGKDIVYRIRGDRLVLYVCGPNQEDNGGRDDDVVLID